MQRAKTGIQNLSVAQLLFLFFLAFSISGINHAFSQTDPIKEKVSAQRVPWQRGVSWQEILSSAQSESFPILIDFTASWCGPCKLLDAMVFNDSRIIAALEQVVTFKVDIDKPQYEELKERFNVQRLPTLIWCNSSGQEVDRFTGYRAATDFLSTIETWQAGSDTYLAALSRHKSNPENPEFVLDLAERYRRRGDDVEAEVLYRRLENFGERADCRSRARGFLGYAEVAGRTGREVLGRDLALRAASLLNDCSDAGAEGLRQVVACQAALGDTSGMMETWRILINLDDHDVAALHGFASAALQQKIELQEATSAALRAAVLSDLDPRMIETLAECYFWQGKYRRAIRWIRKSIEKAPDEDLYRKQLVRFEERLEQDPYGYLGISN